VPLKRRPAAAGNSGDGRVWLGGIVTGDTGAVSGVFVVVVGLAVGVVEPEFVGAPPAIAWLSPIEAGEPVESPLLCQVPRPFLPVTATLCCL
jgi:hypothetical protein